MSKSGKGISRMRLLPRLLIPVFACGVAASVIAQAGRGTDPDWSKLIASMDKMHMAMGATEQSGNNDVEKCANWRRKSSRTSNQKLRSCGVG